MENNVITYTLPLPFRVGSVNCYLVRASAGFVLIDTGCPGNRKELVQRLESAGCKPGLLPLIVITHGDFDHTGNAAYLRRAFGGQIAMHPGDQAMAEQGDMFANRKKSNAALRALVPLVIGFGRSERFTPDLPLQDGHDLNGFGLEARIHSIPGHSQGSVEVLLGSGDFFCGDLLEGSEKPGLNSIMDDPPSAQASLGKMRQMEIRTIYPGHGKPFGLDSVLN